MNAVSSARTRHTPKLILRLIVTGMWIGVLCCALLSVTPHVQAQQQVAYVVDFEGRWFLNGGLPITRKSQSLPGSGTISAMSPSEYDFITIANLNGDVIARRICRTRGECNTPINLPPPPKQPGLLGTAFGAVMSLVWGEPDRYSVHRSRDGELNDGVVQMKDEQIDLSAIFTGSDPGKYHLRLVPVADGVKQTGYKARSRTGQLRRSANQVGPITLDWDRKRASPVTVPGQQFGLYELVLLDRVNDAYSPTDVTAWVLISRPNAYSKSVASYQQAVGLTKTWGNDVTPEAARSFLRAHLDKLARDATK